MHESGFVVHGDCVLGGCAFERPQSWNQAMFNGEIVGEVQVWTAIGQVKAGAEAPGVPTPSLSSRLG